MRILHVVLLTLITGTAIAKTNSLLVPAYFPATYADLSFQERMENEAEEFGYGVVQEQKEKEENKQA